MAGPQVNGEHVYDYIICGGGTSGCVVAGRLAEDSSVTILVIEAGEHIDNVAATQMAGGVPQITGSSADWNIVDQPCKQMNGRQTHLTRGKVLGGSSTCNGTLCIRGTKVDYDTWGLEGWSGDEVFKYMSKSETFSSKSWFEADDHHGTTGPLHTSPHDLAPISELILKSFVSRGFPLKPDMFSVGDTPHGCGHAVRTVSQGLRVTAANFVTRDQKRENVTILTNTYVDKIILGKERDVWKAEGVETVSAEGLKSVFRAHKEIIISAGAYCSPAILLRSGIGAKSDVEKHGIVSYVNLPGVGRNLMDHPIVFTFYEVRDPKLTSDHLIHHEGAQDTAIELWKKDKTGFLSTLPFGAFAYARLDERLADSPLWQDSRRPSGRDSMDLTPQQPHVELFNTECYFGPSTLYTDMPLQQKSAFAMITELFSPRSRGTVELESADPTAKPLVNHNYLDDPLDLLVLAEACRLSNEIVMQGSGTRDIIKGAWPEKLTHHKYTRREEWMGFVKDNSTTCYHPAGTCAMGHDDNPFAVLDAQLRVRGVSKLRVADVSVMPTLNNGHPQMAAYAIGEKAADLLKAAANDD